MMVQLQIEGSRPVAELKRAPDGGNNFADLRNSFLTFQISSILRLWPRVREAAFLLFTSCQRCTDISPDHHTLPQVLSRPETRRFHMSATLVLPGDSVAQSSTSPLTLGPGIGSSSSRASTSGTRAQSLVASKAGILSSASAKGKEKEKGQSLWIEGSSRRVSGGASADGVSASGLTVGKIAVMC